MCVCACEIHGNEDKKLTLDKIKKYHLINGIVYVIVPHVFLFENDLPIRLIDRERER